MVFLYEIARLIRIRLKTRPAHILNILLFIFFFGFSQRSLGQGRVVVNEFMTWSGCNATSEFIELMNFGPGPMNIGCYIVTNGNYAVTIPPNTIVKPGEYFILSGQNTLALNCGNVDSLVHVDLNWNSCNCTDKTIPTTGEGFMKDGGSSNEKVVLLDPKLNVVDAIVRDITKASPSVSITTSGLSGGCTSKTFNLDNMTVNYESVGKSTGIDNSFARKVDGDCGWVKTTAISANAPNKTGSTSSASYDFTTVSASECAGTAGRVSINVSAPDVVSLFPMNYTLAYDADSNNLFNSIDNYTYGADSSASSIDITNLYYGRYRITVGSSSGCNLKSYDFFIFNCYGIVLPVNLVYFKYKGIHADQHWFECRIDGVENLKTVVLEGELNGIYKAVTSLSAPDLTENAITLKVPIAASENFRLRMVSKNGTVTYSPVIKIASQNVTANRLWPNPVTNKVFIQFNSNLPQKMQYSIYNATGIVAGKGPLELKTGNNSCTIDVNNLLPGIYQLEITEGSSAREPISFRFVKH